MHTLAPVGSAPDAPTEPVSTRPRRLVTILWAPVILVIAALAMCGTVTAFHTPAFSPIDEWVYYDYLVKLPEQSVVHQGEHMSRQALEHMSCFGEKTYGMMGPECGGDYSDYAAYPYKGRTTADGYTPLYFGVTWSLGKAIAFVTGLSFLTAARLTGFFWLTGGLLLLYRLARDLKVPKLAVVAVGLGFIGSTFAWWTYTYVSTDAPCFLFGALMLWLTVRFLQGRSSGWWLLPAAVVAVAFKVTNVFAVGLAALVLIVFALVKTYQRRRNRAEAITTGPGPSPTEDSPAVRPGMLWLVAVAIAVAGIATELLWLAIRSAIAVGPPPYQDILVGSSIDWSALGNLTTRFLPHTILNNVVVAGGGGAYSYTIPQFLVVPFSWLLIAGVAAYLFAIRKDRLHTSLSVAIAISAVFFAPILSVAMSLIQGIHFQIPDRYGAALLPGFLLATAILVRARFASWIVIVYGGLLLAYVLATAFHYAP